MTAVDAAGTAANGMYLWGGGSGWNTYSDRNAKENVSPVDGHGLLARLAGIPIESWNYKTQDASIRHIGPMAQDFGAAFGLGEDEKTINSLDADGVALAAIQTLYQITQEQAAEIDGLKEQNAAVEARLASLEARLVALDARGSSEPSQAASFPGAGLLALGCLGAGLALGRRGAGTRGLQAA